MEFLVKLQMILDQIGILEMQPTLMDIYLVVEIKLQIHLEVLMETV